MFERLAGEIRDAQESRDAPTLSATIAAARDLADQLEGHHRARAQVIAFQARRALDELSGALPHRADGEGPHLDRLRRKGR